MLITSQDKSTVVLLENLTSIKVQLIQHKICIVGESINKQYLLGQYSTESVAQRVLHNIIRDYKEMLYDMENAYWYTDFNMPEYH